MARNKSGSCCSWYGFKRTHDLAHADGVEFTLGQCIACGAHIVDCYAPYGPKPESYNVPVVITKMEADEMMAITDFKQLKKYMSDWFNNV
ncbi:MAG TPA: hypothetical protein VIF82_01500 [Burkholderiaceae bacterium]|jgi:hypothetical protein